MTPRRAACHHRLSKLPALRAHPSPRPTSRNTPGHRFFVLLVADLTDPTPFLGGDFEPVMLGEIGIANLRAEAMKYDILELNTNVKPQFLTHLLGKSTASTRSVISTPDIFVYAPLAPVF